MTTTLELINAISQGDATATENAFNAAMAEKISAKLDDMRMSVAQSMFTQPEAVVEEETNLDEKVSGTPAKGPFYFGTKPKSKVPEHSKSEDGPNHKLADHSAPSVGSTHNDVDDRGEDTRRRAKPASTHYNGIPDKL